MTMPTRKASRIATPAVLAAATLLAGCSAPSAWNWTAPWTPGGAEQAEVRPGPAPVAPVQPFPARTPPPATPAVQTAPLAAPPPPAAVVQTAPAPQPIPTRAAAASPSGMTHRVQSGDTVFSLARRYGTTPAEIQRVNGLDQAFTIRIDQDLQIPTGSVNQTVAMAGPSAAPAAPPMRAATPAATQALTAPTRLLQPVDGQLASAFGDLTAAGPNDGVDFLAPTGAPVRAAADGAVAFVSDNTGPLGSVVLVQHGGGMVTIYGRVADATVSPGDMVRAGTQIARVAAPRTGESGLLHFELRRGSEPVDPSPLF